MQESTFSESKRSQARKASYASPKLTRLGDIRGITMGTGTKNPDTLGGGLQSV